MLSGLSVPDVQVTTEKVRRALIFRDKAYLEWLNSFSNSIDKTDSDMKRLMEEVKILVDQDCHFERPRDEDDPGKMNLLFRAIELDSGHQVIQEILDARPELMDTINPYGEAPIHYAAAMRRDVNAVARLDFMVGRLGDVEKALGFQYPAETTPLHTASTSWNPRPSRDVVEYLVKTFPKALKIRDEDGEKPLKAFISDLSYRHGRGRLNHPDTLEEMADIAMTLMSGTPMRRKDAPDFHAKLVKELERTEGLNKNAILELAKTAPNLSS